MATQNEHLGQQAKSTASTIIAADQVEGTSVYNVAGDKLGTVDDIMIDKMSGKVCYAIMSFGGFLGIGESYHPLPWQKLTYDTDKGGFVVDLSKQQLEGAPYHDRRDHAWTPDYGRKVNDYYGIPPMGIV
jgi:sporulation protein YlmC with PRC-barrel domain